MPANAQKPYVTSFCSWEQATEPLFLECRQNLFDISNYANHEAENICKELLQEKELLGKTDHIIKCNDLGRQAHLFCLDNFKKLKLPEDYLLLPNKKRIKVVKLDPPYSSCINSNNDPRLEKQTNKKSNRIKATCLNKFETEKYCIYGDVYEDIDNYVKMGNNVKTADTVKNITSSKTEKKSVPRENTDDLIQKQMKHSLARSLTEAKIEMLKKSTNNQRFFNGVYVAADNEQNKFIDLSNTVLKIFPDRNEMKSSSSSLSEKSLNGKSLNTRDRENDSFKEIVRTISTAGSGFRKTTSDVFPKNILASDGLVNNVNKSSIKGPINLKRSTIFTDAMKHSKTQSIVLKLSKYEKFERQQSNKQEKQLQHHIYQQKKQEQQNQEIQQLQQQQQDTRENKTPNLAKPIIKIQRASSEKKPALKENQRKSIIISYSREGIRDANNSAKNQRTSNNSPEPVRFNNVNTNLDIVPKLEEIEESTNDFKIDLSRNAFDSNRVKTAKSMKSTCSAKSNRSGASNSTPKYVIFSNNNNTSISLPPRVGIKNASIHFNMEETTVSPIFKPQQVSLMPAMSRSLTSYGFDVNNCKSVVDDSNQIFRVNGHGVPFNKQNCSKIPKISFEIASSPFNISNQNSTQHETEFSKKKEEAPIKIHNHTIPRFFVKLKPTN